MKAKTLVSITTFAQYDNYEIMFLSYGAGSKVPKTDGSYIKSKTGHVYVAFIEFGTITKVSGHHPGGLADDSHLLNYANKALKINVSRDELNQAMIINPGSYTIGYNDCVSCVAMVANKIGLDTPSSSDYIATPIGYIEYLISHNSMCRILK